MQGKLTHRAIVQCAHVCYCSLQRQVIDSKEEKQNLQLPGQKMKGKKKVLEYAKNKRSFAMMLARYHQWKNGMKRRIFLFALGRTKAISYEAVLVLNESMTDNQL